MDLREEVIEVAGYEKVIKFTDKDSGLTAIISLHNTKLGPGLGGTRIHPYNSFDKALTDVLRLSKGMTYKGAIAQAGIGGAKSVIIADPTKDKTPELLKAFGEAVNRLEGKYVCAEDVGCTPQDIEEILKTTKYACGVHNLRGSGNPAAFTAWGTYRGVQSVLQELDGTDSVEGKTIAIQGAGNVGWRLAERLFWKGANLIISDVNQEVAERYAHAYGAKLVTPEEILFVECDILAPCAMGAIVNSTSIPKLNCRGIAGAANNQLQDCADADLLLKRGILYAPDFVINSGGLINVINELSAEGYNASKAREMTKDIYDQLLTIYEIAQQESISTHQAAVSLGNHRLERGIGKRIEPLYFRFASAPA